MKLNMYLLMICLLIYFLGAAIGSFVMVVVRRGRIGKPWAKGHSVCESCGKELKWWELIPSFSFIMLRGKCSKCKTKIDPEHFIGETAFGLLFLCLFLLWLPF